MNCNTGGEEERVAARNCSIRLYRYLILEHLDNPWDCHTLTYLLVHPHGKCFDKLLTFPQPYTIGDASWRVYSKLLKFTVSGLTVRVIWDRILDTGFDVVCSFLLNPFYFGLFPRDIKPKSSCSVIDDVLSSPIQISEDTIARSTGHNQQRSCHQGQIFMIRQ